MSQRETASQHKSSSSKTTGKSGVLPQKKQTTSIKKSKHDGSPPRSTTGILRGKPNRGRSQMHIFRREGKIAGKKLKGLKLDINRNPPKRGGGKWGGRMGRPNRATPWGRGGPKKGKPGRGGIGGSQKKLSDAMKAAMKKMQIGFGGGRKFDIKNLTSELKKKLKSSGKGRPGLSRPGRRPGRGRPVSNDLKKLEKKYQAHGKKGSDALKAARTKHENRARSKPKYNRAARLAKSKATIAARKKAVSNRPKRPTRMEALAKRKAAWQARRKGRTSRSRDSNKARFARKRIQLADRRNREAQRSQRRGRKPNLRRAAARATRATARANRRRPTKSRPVRRRTRRRTNRRR